MEPLTQTPTAEDLLALIERLDPRIISERYGQIVTALQARIQDNQEPFKWMTKKSA